MKNKRIKIILFVILSAVFLFAALDVRLKTVTYEIKSEKISAPLRLAVISDLHADGYGRGQRRLVRAIDKQNPDIILYTGDIFHDKYKNDNTIALLKALQGKYPAYYVTGNHEFMGGKPEELRDIMRQYDVMPLAGDWDTVEINGQTVNICGADDPAADTLSLPELSFRRQLQALEAAAENGAFTLLLAHRPERFDEYALYPFDLVLSGHAHGGQWRIPGIINGLYAPVQGFLPELAGGVYARGDMTMVVSRGLDRKSVGLPRVFNRPELVIININAI